MNCPRCDKPMLEREEHEFIEGTPGSRFEFRVHVCESAFRGHEPGEPCGERRCEHTLYYEPVNEPRGCPLLVDGPTSVVRSDQALPAAVVNAPSPAVLFDPLLVVGPVVKAAPRQCVHGGPFDPAHCPSCSQGVTCGTPRLLKE